MNGEMSLVAASPATSGERTAASGLRVALNRAGKSARAIVDPSRPTRAMLVALQAVAAESSLFGASVRDLNFLGLSASVLSRCRDRGWLRLEEGGSSAVYRLTDTGIAVLRRAAQQSSCPIVGIEQPRSGRLE